MELNISFKSRAVINHGCNIKECQLGNEANHDHANKNASFSYGDNEWHKPQLLFDNKSTFIKQTNNPSIKGEEQAVCTKVENLTNATDIGMNATHICGILMESVNVNYTRNIYFTVKTTHKYYTNRLLLLMLTWLQTVDKNKVRNDINCSGDCMLFYLKVYNHRQHLVELHTLC